MHKIKQRFKKARKTHQRYNRAPLSRRVVHLRCSDLVLERTISAESSRVLGHEHHNRGAGAICKQRGTCRGAYGSRRAHRRCNRAPLSRPVVHLRCSDLVLECTISADLSRVLGHEHHNRGAGAICKQRGTCHDAYGSRRAHRRCSRAPLSRPVVHLRCSDLVLERTISAELSRVLGHEHHNRGAGAICKQ